MEDEVAVERLRMAAQVEADRRKRQQKHIEDLFWKQSLRDFDREEFGGGPKKQQKPSKNRHLASVKPPFDELPATLPPLTDTEVIDIEMEMERRRVTMQKTCAENRLNTEVAESDLDHEVGWEFMYASKKKLLWCHVFKSASST